MNCPKCGERFLSFGGSERNEIRECEICGTIVITPKVEYVINERINQEDEEKDEKLKTDCNENKESSQRVIKNRRKRVKNKDK